jgi:hypothetical protein
MKSILKDLLYTTGNQALDIARLCSAFGVLTFLFLAIWQQCHGEKVSLTEFGIGWASVCGGCAAWIYARQHKERQPGE